MNRHLRGQSFPFCYWLLAAVAGWLTGCAVDDLPTRRFPTCTVPAAQIGITAKLLEVAFALESTTGTIGRVNWDFGDGGQATTTTLASRHVFALPGTYTTSAKLTNECGDTVKVTKEIVIDNTVIPTVTTLGYADLNITTATFRLAVNDKGNGRISQYGICYSLSNAQPTITTSTTVGVGNDLAVGVPVSFSVSQLLAGTVYYFRAFATNNAGTGYGSIGSVLTSAPPSLTTLGASSVGTTTASVTFRATDPGNPPATRYGICYSSATNTPTVGSPGSSVVNIDAPAIGTNVILSLTGLLPATTYSYRAFATNALGTFYSTNTLTFTTQTDVDLTTGLIGSYSFSGSGTDASSYKNHGTLKGGASFGPDRQGKAGAALLLDGTSGYFDIPDDASLRPSTLSVSVWIRPANLNRIMQIYNKSNVSTGAGEQYSSLIKLPPSGSGVTVNVDVKQESNCEVSKGWQTATFTSGLPLNVWHHLVSVLEGSTLRLYFDGNLLTTTPLTASGIDNCAGGSLKFGAQYKGFENYFDGSLDDIRIYSRALTDAQVKSLFNQ